MHPKLKVVNKGVFWTGGSLNPARSFGPAVIIRSFEDTHWIYWVGPFAGSILATLMFKLIKALEYTTVNGEGAGEEKKPIDIESQSVADKSRGAADPGLGSVAYTTDAQDLEKAD